MGRRHIILAVSIPLAATVALPACGRAGSPGADGRTGGDVAGAPAAAGSSGDAGAPAGDAGIVARAAAASSKLSSARVAMTVALDVAGLPDAPAKPFKIGGEGELDLQGRRGHLLLDARELAGAVGAGSSMPATIDLVMDGTTAYVRVPDDRLARTGGKHWVRADDSGTGAGFDLASLAGLGDPAGAFGMLSDATGSPERVGTDELRGTAVTHYRIHIDPAAAARSAGTAPTDGGPLGALGMAALGGAGTMPAELWVDGQGRARKMSITIDLGAMLASFASARTPAGASSGTTLPADMRFAMTMSVELWDFDAAVSVTVPDAADVADAATAAGLFKD